AVRESFHPPAAVMAARIAAEARLASASSAPTSICNHSSSLDTTHDAGVAPSGSDPTADCASFSQRLTTSGSVCGDIFSRVGYQPMDLRGARGDGIVLVVALV